MKLIDKSALVAEIEKYYKEYSKRAKTYIDDANYWTGKADAYRYILTIIDTLEVKEANSVWHDAIELPDETSLILLSLKDGNFILADEKTAYIRELVDKWCYVSDI